MWVWVDRDSEKMRRNMLALRVIMPVTLVGIILSGTVSYWLRHYWMYAIDGFLAGSLTTTIWAHWRQFSFRGRDAPPPGPAMIISETKTQITCSYCGGCEFHRGPQGGGSVNIVCANPDCRHRFNFTPMLGEIEDLHMVEPLG